MLRDLAKGALIAEPEGPTFISYEVARSRLDRLRFVTQDPTRTWPSLRLRRSIEGALISFVGRVPSIARRADAVLDACLH